MSNRYYQPKNKEVSEYKQLPVRPIQISNQNNAQNKHIQNANLKQQTQSTSQTLENKTFFKIEREKPVSVVSSYNLCLRIITIVLVIIFLILVAIILKGMNYLEYLDQNIKNMEEKQQKNEEINNKQWQRYSRHLEDININLKEQIGSIKTRIFTIEGDVKSAISAQDSKLQNSQLQFNKLFGSFIGLKKQINKMTQIEYDLQRLRQNINQKVLLSTRQMQQLRTTVSDELQKVNKNVQQLFNSHESQIKNNYKQLRQNINQKALFSAKQMQQLRTTVSDELQKVNNAVQPLFDQKNDLHIQEMKTQIAEFKLQARQWLQQKSMTVFQKQKKQMKLFKFQIETGYKYYEYFSYPTNSNLVRKYNDGIQFFFSKRSISTEGDFYFQVQIKVTKSKKIAIGIMPESKKMIDNLYDDSTQLNYIYCRNGHMYHGKGFLNIYYPSEPTKVEEIDAHDVVGVVYNNQKRLVSYFVNGKYVGSDRTHQNVRYMHAFVGMESAEDQVQIIAK